MFQISKSRRPISTLRNFIVVTGARWIAARELASQADDLDGDGRRTKLFFLPICVPTKNLNTGFTTLANEAAGKRRRRASWQC